MTPFSLQRKRILVTGASSGIGKATAIACAQMGASIIACGRNEERLNGTMNLLVGDGHLSEICELTNEQECQSMCERLPSLDGAVFCAATLQTLPARFINRDRFLSQFDTNLFSVATLMAKLIQNRKINKGASLVFLSSISSTSAGERGNAMYSATKAALESYCRILALELANRKIRVNCIAPGMVSTPFLNNFEATAEDLADNEKK